jgi:ketosteroid isomerase-like protein
MASPNVELVRSIYADWERGDFSSAVWADSEIEFVAADGPSPCRRTGVADMEEAWRDFLTAWGDYRIVPDEYRELDDARVLVLSRVRGRGEMSELQLEQRRAAIFQIRGGKVIKYVVWWDRDRALADLGLAPGGDLASE